MILHLGSGVEVPLSQRGMGAVAGFFSRVGFEVTVIQGARALRKGCKGEVLIAGLLQSSPHSHWWPLFMRPIWVWRVDGGEWVHLNSAAKAVTHLKCGAM